MSEKFLGVIQTFTQKDLEQLLQKNGCGELNETLANGGITDGSKLLELSELQMLKWKLPPSSKKKLLSFLSELKQNPQKFLSKEDKEKHGYLSRRTSFRFKTEFQEKLEQVITITKPTDMLVKKRAPSPEPTEKLEQVNTLTKPMDIPVKRRAPSPIPIEKTRAPSPPVEEYLPMDLGKEANIEEHYDESGYLRPVKSNVEEENNYELSPTDKVSPNFIASNLGIRISERPPLALPRDSTDERGYITGPVNLEETTSISFPRVNRNQRPFPLNNQPVFILTDNPEEDEPEVAYEQINEENSNTESEESPNFETHTRSMSKLLDLLKINKRPDALNLEQSKLLAKSLEQIDINLKTSRSNNSPSTTPSEQDSSPRYLTRPLPPLPPVKTDEPLEPYENIESHRKYPVQDNTRLNEILKSKHGGSQLDQNPDLTYGNIEEEPKKKLPESYELYRVDKSKSTKRTLPLPPVSLPQIKLDDMLVGNPPQRRNLKHDSIEFNFNNEPFYRNTDRKGARLLLQDLEDGAFLFRPSNKYPLTLSLKYHGRCHNLGIEKTDDNQFRLFTTGSHKAPAFSTLTEFVEHFTTNLLTFEYQGMDIETLLTTSLPSERF